ncbi:hypothetical protein E2562_005652 [Oryza meyeriana var. granulata]|uniref:Uncharacterized protein n=1 Tax=Oryza meyeriana var. granulata TaxID=110450 RepID=A0A6G1BHY3_9ORYZ|nr:hypothetical protein E2562_005652 [Oryza meyeriana var. granulata]
MGIEATGLRSTQDKRKGRGRRRASIATGGCIAPDGPVDSGSNSGTARTMKAVMGARWRWRHSGGRAEGNNDGGSQVVGRRRKSRGGQWTTRQWSQGIGGGGGCSGAQCGAVRVGDRGGGRDRGRSRGSGRERERGGRIVKSGPGSGREAMIWASDERR